ncbi:MAG: tetratricopeptide repeat protein [Terriglobia bacterium]
MRPGKSSGGGCPEKPRPTLTVEDAWLLANQLYQAGGLQEAEQLCQKILSADSRNPQALRLAGALAHQRGDHESALHLIRKAIEFKPTFAEAHSTLGRVLRDQGKLEESIASYRRATALDPQLATAHNDLGNVLVEQGKRDEALACYQRALEIRPSYPEAHNNLGNLCQMNSQFAEALACYQKAIDLSPTYAEAYRNLGSALVNVGRLPEAIASFQTAISIQPAFTEAIAQLEHQMRNLCEWNGLDVLSNLLIDRVERHTGCVNPFVFLTLDTTPQQQFRCARQWAAQNLRGSNESARQPGFATRRQDKITLGYLSCDFHEHATAHLTSELFELHDRSRFEVTAYSYGPDDGSLARRRLVAAFDRFVDIAELSFADAARQIRQDGVDILVDLKGYTANARPPIVALRPAPVQVNYMGFPGTLGSRAIDYIIADQYVIPSSQQPFFSEKLVHLPDCYLVNDRTRKISPHVPSRQDCGLPEAGVVFCCFNTSYKITRRMFDIWMRLLKAVPGSALWLLESNPHATGNLKKEASARDVSAERLIFAPVLPNPDHLARFALADLFLDTLPYNAHTLASDALWGGCPVVTCSGRTFVSRVAGSLLNAVGLPELVTTSLEAYESLAFELARDPDRLRSIRQKLAANRLTTPLFDSRRFTRNLEAAYESMWSAYRKEEAPSSG